MRSRTWLGGLAALLCACGDVDGLNAGVETIVSIPVRLHTRPEALWQYLVERDPELEGASWADLELTAQLHWVRPAVPDPMCNDLREVFNDPHCPGSEVFFHLEHTELSPASVALRPQDLSGEITLSELPPLGLGSESEGERLLFASVLVTARDLRRPFGSASIIGASWYEPQAPFERVAYREGRSADHSLYYNETFCPEIPPGFTAVSADPTTATCAVRPIPSGISARLLSDTIAEEIWCHLVDPGFYEFLEDSPRYYDPLLVKARSEDFWSEPSHYTCRLDGSLSIDGFDTSSPVHFALSGYDLQRCNTWSHEAPAFWPCPLPGR